MPLGCLLEGVAVLGPTRGPDGLDEQLVRLERGREVGDEELLRRNCAAGARHHRTAQDGERERQLGGGVGVRDRAADRAPVARDEVADVRQALGEERDLEQPPVGLADERAYAPRPVFPRDLAERQPVHVHEHGRPGKPHIQHRDEALPAREHLRLVAELRNRLIDRAGPLVAERDGLHRVTPASPRRGRA